MINVLIKGGGSRDGECGGTAAVCVLSGSGGDVGSRKLLLAQGKCGVLYVM